MIKIDGREYKALNMMKQFRVDMTGGTLSDRSDWSVIKQLPVLQSPQFSPKTCTIEVLIDAPDQASARDLAGWITNGLKGMHIVSFDGIEHSFRGILTGSKFETLVQNRRYKATYTLKGYEVGDEINETIVLTLEHPEQFITNPGTAWTPARAEFSVLTSDATSICGLLRDPATMKQVPMYARDYYYNTSLDPTLLNPTIDGTTGAVFWKSGGQKMVITNTYPITEERVRNSLREASRDLLNCFGLPILAPGENEVYLAGAIMATAHMQIDLTYRPVYM